MRRLGASGQRFGRALVAVGLAIATLLAFAGLTVLPPVTKTAQAATSAGTFGGVAWAIDSNNVLTLSPVTTVTDTTNKCDVWPSGTITSTTKFTQNTCQSGQLPSNGTSVTGSNGVGGGSSSSTFYPWANNTSITSVVISGSLSVIGNADYLFYGMSSVTSIAGAGNINTSKLTSAEYLVGGANGKSDTALKAFPDVSDWDMSNLRDAAYMFSGISTANYPNGVLTVNPLRAPSVGNWSTGNLQTTAHMFEGDYSLTSSPDVSKWDISSLVNADSMFNMTSYNNGSVGLSRLDFTSWTTDKVSKNATSNTFMNMLNQSNALVDIVLPANSVLMSGTYGSPNWSTTLPTSTGWVNINNSASTPLNAQSSVTTAYTKYGAGEYVVKAIGTSTSGNVLYMYNGGHNSQNSFNSMDSALSPLPYSGTVGVLHGSSTPFALTYQGYILCGWSLTPSPASDSCADQTNLDYPTKTDGTGGGSFTLTSSAPAQTFYAIWAINAAAVLPSLKFSQSAVTANSSNPGTYTFPIFIGNNIDVSVGSGAIANPANNALGTYLTDSGKMGGGASAVKISVTDAQGKSISLNSDGKTFTPPKVSTYPYAAYAVTYTYPYASPVDPNATLTATVNIQVKDYTGILASPRVVVKVADIDAHDPFADIASSFKADHTLICGNVPKVACDDSSHTPLQVNGSPIHAWIVDDSSDARPTIWDSVKNVGTLPQLQAGGIYSELFSVKDYSGNDVTTQYDTSDSSQSGPVAATLLKVSDSALSLDVRNQYTYKGIPWSPLDDFVAATDVKGSALTSPNKDANNNLLPPTVTYANGQASFGLVNSNGSATVTVTAYEGWDLSEDYSKGDVSCADRTGDTPVSLTAGYTLGPGPYCVSYTLNSTVNGTTSTLTTVIGLFVDMSPQGHTYPKGSDTAQPITANALYSPNDNFVLAYDIQGTIEQIADLVNGAPIKETIVKCSAGELASDGSVPKTGCTGAKVYDDTVRTVTDSDLKTFTFASLTGGGAGTYSVLYTITDGSVDNTNGKYIYDVSSEAVRLDVVAPYKAYFNGNGGADTVSGSMSPIVVPIDAGSDSVGHLSPLPSSGFTRDGYTFAGWDVCPGTDLKTDCDSGLLSIGGSSPDITSDVTLFAQWQKQVIQPDDAVLADSLRPHALGIFLLSLGVVATGLFFELSRRHST